MSLIVEIPAHLSWSQVSSLIGSYCPAQYFYGRLLGKEERPGWASVGGSGVHTATEDWDRLVVESGEFVTDPEAIAVMFNTAFSIEIARTEQGSNFPREEWRASGRASKDNPDKENEKWWRGHGPAMLARYANWRMSIPWEIAALTNSDGEEVMGIEIPIGVEIGGVPVRGYVDRVFEREGEYLCVDIKSGSMAPKTAGQLGTYRAGILDEYGVDCKVGAFWMARTGDSGSFFDLTQWTKERLDFTFAEARSVQERGAFMHRPSNLCGACALADYCPEVNGIKAAETPQPWSISEVRIAEPKSSVRG